MVANWLRIPDAVVKSLYEYIEAQPRTEAYLLYTQCCHQVLLMTTSSFVDHVASYPSLETQ